MNHMNDAAVVENVIVENVVTENVETTPTEAVKAAPQESGNKRVKAAHVAKSKDPNLAGSYLVTTALNMRHGASMNEKIMTVIPKNTKVRNYGFYTDVNGDRWLYVQAILANVVYNGFCASNYLTKI